MVVEISTLMTNPKIFRILEELQDASEKNYYVNESQLKIIDSPSIGECERLGYIQRSGPHYILKDKGYDVLQKRITIQSLRELKAAIKSFDEGSTELNKKMLEHTKTMKTLTKWMLLVTAVNLLLIIFK